MIGQTVSHHRVIERLGAGGMGVVYKAEDIKLSRQVALKFLSVDHADDQQAIERFQREARTASSLNHPNICTIYEIDEHDGLQFIAMELLQGQPLDKRIGGRPLPVGEVLELGIQIADALDAAHTSGILHRDIKPANIFITSRAQAKILDFGLAKLAESRRAATSLDLSSDPTRLKNEFLTTKGMTVGTIAYMSPEQARGEDLDCRSDLFSFGVVLYEMATGRQTFTGSTSAVIFDAILNREPAAPIEVNTEVPPDLERIIGKAIDKDRRMRYQTAAEMRTDLQRVKRSRESNRVAVSGSTPSVSAVGSRWPSTSDVVPAAVAPVPAPSATVPAPASAGHPVAHHIARSTWIVAAIGALCFVGAGVFFYQSRVQPADTSRAVDVPAPADAGATPPAPSSPAEVAPAAAAPADTVAPSAPPPPLPPTLASAPTPAARGGSVPTAGTPPASGAASGARRSGESGPPALSLAPALPPAASPTVTVDPAAEGLRIARSKFEAKLYDQALTDLKALAESHPSSPSAPGVLLLTANAYERQGRIDDALAAYVELRDRHRSSAAAAEGTYLMGNLLLRSRRTDRDEAARQTYSDVAETYAKTPWAPRALMARASIEERTRSRVPDPTLKVSVPAALISYRTLAERYADAEGLENILWRLSEMYEDMNQFVLAAQSLDTLAARFPDNKRDAQWRAAELYDKKVRDAATAKAAYARVPASSSHYRDAQKRAGTTR